MLSVTRVIGHKEYGCTPPGGWAGRKTDPVYDMNWRRARVANFRPRTQEDDMPLTDADINRIRDRILHSPVGPDGRIVNGQPWFSTRAAGTDAAVHALVGEVRALRAGQDGLVRLVAEQNGLRLEDVRRVVAEEVARGIDVDVTVSGGDQPPTP
jgi:hypothetical protein